MTLRRLSIILSLIVASLSLRAQSDAQFTQYFAVPTYYNPAAAGQTGMLNITAGSRLQWVGVDHAPKSFMALADMPLRIMGRNAAGAGISVSQESLGLFKGLTATLQASWKFNVAGGALSVGVEAGFINQTFSGSKVILPNDDNGEKSTDEGIPSTDLSGHSFDLGIGVCYSRPRFRTGLSLRHANSPTVTFSSGSTEDTSGKTYEFQTGRTLYFTAEGNIPLGNSLFEMIASMLAKTDFTFSTAEATARLRYRKFLSAGIGYRHDDAVSLMIGAEIRNFSICYSYDYPTGAMAGVSSGSHELTASYRMKIDLSEKNRHKHKSIRIM